jgi:hypothetical protein
MKARGERVAVRNRWMQDFCFEALSIGKSKINPQMGRSDDHYFRVLSTLVISLQML